MEFLEGSTGKPENCESAHNRCVMEPPDAWFQALTHMYPNTFITSIDIVFICKYTGVVDHVQFGLASSLRLRGGMDNPSGNQKDARVPYFDNIRFMFKGIPCVDFNEKVMMPLQNGLATVSVRGYSLLDTCRRIDAGGILGNPARAVAPNDIIEASLNRNKMAFAVIMNYTLRTCSFYKMAMREMNQSGIHVLQAIRTMGVIQTPPRIIKSRDNGWDRMNMAALFIPYDSDGWFTWGDIVYEVGRKLSRDGQKQKDKFLEGLPDFMKETKELMRQDTAPDTMHPATWGGIFPGCPNAANPHPLARQPSVPKLAVKYFESWVIHSNLANKERPFGIGRALQVDVNMCHEIDDVIALLDSSKIDSNTVCFYCGGKYHGVVNKLSDGTIIPCAAKAIRDSGQSNVPEPGPKTDWEKKFKRQAKELSVLTDEINSLKTHISDLEANKLHDSPGRSMRRRSGSPGPRMAKELDTEDSHEESTNEAEQEDSDDSEASHVSEFANAMFPYNKKKAAPPKRR